MLPQSREPGADESFRPLAHRGGKHPASFREARPVPFDVVEVDDAMDSNQPIQCNEELVAEFRTLWESSPAPPNILQFLANRPDAAPQRAARSPANRSAIPLETG